MDQRLKRFEKSFTFNDESIKIKRFAPFTINRTNKINYYFCVNGLWKNVVYDTENIQMKNYFTIKLQKVRSLYKCNK